MKRVNIITWSNGAGLSRNIGILSHLLQQAGFRVAVNGLQGPTLRRELYRAASQRLLRRPVFDINLFLQYVIPKWFGYARVNCLIPNQEWFEDQWLCHLRQLDWVLCKTKHAQEIFSRLGCRTEFISFTSVDRFDKTGLQNYDKFFHLAGHSLQKGTNTLIDVWLRHPKWPRLTIIQDPRKAKAVDAGNIEFIAEYVNDEVLREVQSSHGVHLCPSEAEGFGHYIVEAMSCQAATVTTDAPPMNEILTPERGVLVGHRGAELQRLGINYYVDSSALEQKVEELLSMDVNAKRRLGEAARDWYRENDRFFRQKIVEVLKDISRR